MEQIPTLYTYGNIHIKAEELIAQLTPFGINCVVDCCFSLASEMPESTSVNSLKETLKQHNITYLPFFDHFGFIPSEMRNKRGEPVYQKVIQSERFQQGIERISNGIKKGYQICIIDNQEETPKSKRFTLIGRYLKDTYQIIHINPNGHYFTQIQVEQQIEERKSERIQKNQKSKEVGQTGEELAALFLTRNGYQILDKNWNLHRGCELDIIAMKDNKLHFIEVKTRTSDKYGAPQEAINYKKMNHITKAIRAYRYKRFLHNIDYQIDSIAIIYHANNDYSLKHFLGLSVGSAGCSDVHTFVQKP